MNTKQKYIFNLYSVVYLAIVAVFCVLWFMPSNIPNNFAGALRFVDVLLFAGVSYVIWHPLIMQLFSWTVASHIKPLPERPLQPNLHVAFITNFVPASESIDLLRSTLPAMVRAHYMHDTWLLDEGDDPQAKALCTALGVKYFSRKTLPAYNTATGKFAAKTKGGNHNAWYDMFGHRYDIVAQIDTDFIPRRDFLLATLPYFSDPRVAFVGTPQIYGNTANSLIARGAAEQTYSFYGHILSGFAGMGSTILIGANHVIRVSALSSVDHYSAHITEDLITGMKLHAAGYKSIYVPQALAIGEGPTTWQAFFNQQMRWAFGCIDILFRHSTKLYRTMSLRQKVYYFVLKQHYFSGLATIMGLLGIGLYFVFGLGLTDIDTWLFVAGYGVAIGVSYGGSLWLQRFHVRPKHERGLLLSAGLLHLMVWPVFFLALIGVIRQKRLTFKVTPKGNVAVDITPPLKLFAVHIGISLYALACLSLAAANHTPAQLLIFWLCITLLSALAMPSYIIYATIKKRASALQFTPKSADISESQTS